MVILHHWRWTTKGFGVGQSETSTTLHPLKHKIDTLPRVDPRSRLPFGPGGWPFFSASVTKGLGAHTTTQRVHHTAVVTEK